MDLLDNIFMIPGPVKMHPRVLDAMSRAAVAHRSAEFRKSNAELRELFKYLFQSQQDVAVFTGSGTAGLEAAVVNVISPDTKVLAINNGKFSERSGKIAKKIAHVEELSFEWGKAPDLSVVEEKAEGKDIITLCHNETSASLTNPAEEIGKIARKNDALFILDGITSVGGIETIPEKLNADAIIMGSQKCVAGPAGLSAVSVSERYKERMHNKYSYYLDIAAHIKKLQGDDTPYTPATHLFMGMREALLILKEEGLENRIRRCAILADATRKGGEALGLKLFADPKYASDTVTGFWLPEGITDKDFRGNLSEKFGVFIAGAQDHLKGKVIRIGHMGIAKPTDLMATFGAMEAVFKKLGANLNYGQGVGTVSQEMGKFL